MDRVPPGSKRKRNIAVLISGSGTNLQAILDACTPTGPLSDACVSLVLSNRKAAYGLTRATSHPASLGGPVRTKVLSLKTWREKKENEGKSREDYDEEVARAVLELGAASEGEGRRGGPDLVVLAGWMHILSSRFLRALGHGEGDERPASSSSSSSFSPPAHPIPIINLHPALPGAFDGSSHAIRDAHEAFARGEVLSKKTGAMVHEVIADVDKGAPVVVEEVEMRPGETLDELEARIHQVEHRIIVDGARKVLDRLEKEGR